jgi:hypothetical protein
MNEPSGVPTQAAVAVRESRFFYHVLAAVICEFAIISVMDPAVSVAKFVMAMVSPWVVPVFLLLRYRVLARDKRV